jgi:hypothetical protein
MEKKTRRISRQESADIGNGKKVLKQLRALTEYTPKGQLQLPEEVIQGILRVGIQEEVEKKHTRR